MPLFHVCSPLLCPSDRVGSPNRPLFQKHTYGANNGLHYKMIPTEPALRLRGQWNRTPPLLNKRLLRASSSLWPMMRTFIESRSRATQSRQRRPRGESMASPGIQRFSYEENRNPHSEGSSGSHIQWGSSSKGLDCSSFSLGRLSLLTLQALW